MNFLFVSAMAGCPWGGSEELWSQAALRLREQGQQVSASVVWWPQLSPKVTHLAGQGIDVVTHGRPPANLAVTIRRRLKKKMGWARSEVSWLRRKKPDFVVISQGCNWDGLEWMGICRENNVPYAAIVQCNAESWWPSDAIAAEMALAYRSAKKVFCVSHRNLSLLRTQIGEPLPNASVVWNPFNVPASQPPAWPTQNGVWKAACVARLEPGAKGQDLLFQILSQANWANRPLEVNLYGAGAGEQNLKKLAAQLQTKNVHFRGHVADVRKIWEENHLLILPSRCEGLPLALVEAMWCARPSVVTDAGGNSEICVDGETGFIAAAPALGLLEKTLERAWEHRNEWQSMGESARTRAEQLVPKDPVGDFCKLLIESVPR
jgi:glycosyltransferase involved in cell wall biosynthesis